MCLDIFECGEMICTLLDVVVRQLMCVQVTTTTINLLAWLNGRAADL